MSRPVKVIRLDPIEHELAAIRKNHSVRDQDMGTAFKAEIEHDLLVWPREYLEPYLDSDADGAVVFNSVELQGFLEAAIGRDQELSRNEIRNQASDRVREKQESMGKTSALQSARGRTSHTEPSVQLPLTDSGAYTGRIVGETRAEIPQRISSTCKIAYPKSLIPDIPWLDKLVRIAYREQVATVRIIEERELGKDKELAR